MIRKRSILFNAAHYPTNLRAPYTADIETAKEQAREYVRENGGTGYVFMRGGVKRFECKIAADGRLWARSF